MAILAPLLAFLGRFVGKFLNKAFGWASVMLFGRVPHRSNCCCPAWRWHRWPGSRC
jgi:hypothetical protein